MPAPSSSRALLGLVLFLIGGMGASPLSAPAQDRSVPRFGPLVAPDTVEAGEYDLGRVWSFADPPLEYLSDTYGVPADTQGVRALRRRTFRLPGCSGTLVSPDGLLLTAARCVRSRLSPTSPDSLRTDAVLARQSDQERPLDSLYAERVVGVDDVTDRVEAQVAQAAAPEARRAAVQAVQETLAEQAGPSRRVEVVSEAGGTRYAAYTYRRYDDVRLVFLPERAVTLFGASDQLLSYPQHAWDVAALRVYDDEAPLSTPDHFDVRRPDVRPGDAVFAVGHPPAGPRAESAEQGAFRRDVSLPADLAALRSWTAHLRTYTDTAAASSPVWTDRLQEARETQKRHRAQLHALEEDYVEARLTARDARLRRRSAERDDLEGGSLLDRLAALQTEKRALADSYRAFSFLLRPQHSSATVRRALIAYRARQTGAPNAADAMRAVPDQPRALDAALLEGHRERLRTHLGNDSTVARALDRVGRSEGIVRGSVFSEEEAAVSALDAASLPDDDPALRVVAALYDQYASFEEAWTDLRVRETRLTDSLAQVRHRASAAEIALAQSRAPRMADGRARGYDYNGTVAAAFTTFYGLYAHHTAASESAPPLPARWEAPPRELNRAVPLTRIASTDLQGDYGGPLVDASLRLVGIQTDGNVQSAGGAFLFLPRRMRTVAVDVSGVLEALSAVYEAEALVEELQGTPADE